MINRVALVGRLTRDPELRRTNNGTAVTSFTLAVNRTFQSADGQDADFIQCVCWNKLAENVDTYCSKGSLVGIEGKLRSRSYDNAQGQKVYVVEVICDVVQFIETKRDRQNDQPSQSQYHQQQSYQQPVQQHNSFYNANIVQDNDLESFQLDPDDIQF